MGGEEVTGASLVLHYVGGLAEAAGCIEGINGRMVCAMVLDHIHNSLQFLENTS